MLSLRKIANLFQVNTAEEIRYAHTVILATGIQDKRLPLDNWEEHVRNGTIRLCPICDAHENTGQNIALISTTECAVRHARFLRTYFKKLSLFTQPGDNLCCSDIEELLNSKIHVNIGKFESISIINNKPWIHSLDGGCHGYDSLYIMLGETRRTELARRLGAAFSTDGNLLVNEHQSSTIDGLYAVGDVVSRLHQISVAIGQATTAATQIHNHLADNFFEE